MQSVSVQLEATTVNNVESILSKPAITEETKVNDGVGVGIPGKDLRLILNYMRGEKDTELPTDLIGLLKLF